MKDGVKTKEQLITELAEMRQRIAELEAAETERVQAEDALRESEHRYRLLADNITDVIWTADLNLRFTYISPSITRMLGYSIEEAMAKTVEEVLTPASLDVAMQVFAEEMTVEEMEQKNLSRSRALELEYYCKDNSTIWVENKVTGLRDPDDRLVEILGVARDITKRKQAEEYLRQRTAQSEALEEAAAAVSSTLDLDEVLDRILEQVERVVPGDVFNVMLVEENHARTVRWRGYERFDAGEFISTVAFPIPETPTLQQMVETGKPVIIPDTGAAPNWVTLPALEWLRSYVAAPIQVTGLTIGFLNVDGTRPDQFGLADARRLEAFASHAATAIENAQLYQRLQEYAGQLEQRVQERTAELQAQYTWLDAILRSTTDGIVVTNEEGSIVQANPVAQAWLTQTLSPEEAGRLREAVQSVARQACAEETGFSGKNPVSLLELTGLDLELNAALVVEEGAGKPTAAVVDIHDVTHLKALDRMKTRFITNISHELRTPIAAIKLYAYLMRQQPEKCEQYLDTLAHEADHQAGLVEGILEISRIDAGRMEMKPRPTSLNELTEAVVASHHVLAEERGLTLEHRPETRFFGKDPVSLVDPERMMQVLNNLVGNGIRYTPEGGTVVVSTGTEEAEGRTWATVTVADTGMGIPEDELPHAFDRFFRGAEPRAMQLTGTGLGLAIAKEIVELHGGYVTVESPSTALRAGEEGIGSTFTVWLPLSDQSKPDRFLSETCQVWPDH